MVGDRVDPAPRIGSDLFRIAGDPDYRASVALAHQHGIPHSKYLTWSPDDREAEARYLEHERHQESGTCQQCGIHRSTWDPDWGGDKFAPTMVPVIRFCLACQMYAQKQKEMESRGLNVPGYFIAWEPAKS